MGAEGAPHLPPSVSTEEHLSDNIYPGAHHYLRASSVLLFSEGLLGSPIPIRLAATTRNSYSTQGFRPTTVAVNVRPSMISGTRREPQVRNATDPTKTPKKGHRYP